jgi:ribosomal protein S19
MLLPTQPAVHQLGEFAPTRHFRGHSGDSKTQVKK